MDEESMKALHADTFNCVKRINNLLEPEWGDQTIDNVVKTAALAVYMRENIKKSFDDEVINEVMAAELVRIVSSWNDETF